jgi:putative flippase GtrA
MRSAATRFFRFALVGGIGFVVDAGALTALHDGVGLNPFTARAVSIVSAAFATWRLNRALTFGASAGSETAEGLRYGLVAALAAAVSYFVYAALLVAWPALAPLAAVVLATLVAMGFSYAGYSRFVFGPARSAVSTPPNSQRR